VLRIQLLLNVGAQDLEVLVQLADDRLVDGLLELARHHATDDRVHERLNVRAVLLPAAHRLLRRLEVALELALHGLEVLHFRDLGEDRSDLLRDHVQQRLVELADLGRRHDRAVLPIVREVHDAGRVAWDLGVANRQRAVLLSRCGWHGGGEAAGAGTPNGSCCCCAIVDRAPRSACGVRTGVPWWGSCV
jgi:hypothetical protein